MTLARAVAYARSRSLDPREPAGAALAGADIIACSLGPNNAHWAITSVLDDALTFAATQGRGGKGIADLLGGRQRAESRRQRRGLFASEDDRRRPLDSERQGERVGVRARTRFPGPRRGRLQHRRPAAATARPPAPASPRRARPASRRWSSPQSPTATADEVRKILSDTLRQDRRRHLQRAAGTTSTASAESTPRGRSTRRSACKPTPCRTTRPPRHRQARRAGPQLPTAQGRRRVPMDGAVDRQTVKLANADAERELDVSLIDGRAVFEGDIVLTRGLETLGVGHSDVGRRWPARRWSTTSSRRCPTSSASPRRSRTWEAKHGDHVQETHDSRRTTSSFAPAPAAVRRSG